MAVAMIDGHVASSEQLVPSVDVMMVERSMVAPTVSVHDSKNSASSSHVSDSSTVQLGFVNVTQRIKGVQIGFLNVASNGFLPVFPFFNFPKN